MSKKDQPSSSNSQPKVGDLVRLKNGKTTGKLDAINGNKAIIITNGSLRINTEYRNLRKVTDENTIQKLNYGAKNSHSGINYERKIIEPRLDIHGLRAEEAKKKVTRYLDNALVSSRNEVEIMHGKGSGVLKNLVHELLDKRNDVKGYRMASLVRGGAGCTIVSL